MGKLMKKIQCQFRLSVDSSRPAWTDGGSGHHGHAIDPKAWPRFWTGKGVGQDGCSEGCKPPAARALNTRATIRKGRFGAMPQRNDDTVKSTTQVM